MNTEPELLSKVGSICSIAGLVVTFWIFIKLRRIHRSFLFQARLPDLRKKIRGHRSSLSRLLNDFPNTFADVQIELQRCHANLQSLKPKLGRAQVPSVNSLLEQIEELNRLSALPSKEPVQRVYLDLVLLEGELDNLSEDIKWRSRE